MLALLYIGGFIAIGLGLIALLYVISPLLAGAFIGLLWYWAYRTPSSSDWRFRLLRRKPRPSNSASK